MKTPRITGSAPILLVKDVEASANYYRDKVGFTYSRFWGDPPGFCILFRDGFHLMLCQVDRKNRLIPHYKVVHNMWNVYFWVDDARKMYDELVASGVIIDYHLELKDHGCLEFGIQDLDGYDIAFGEIIDNED